MPGPELADPLDVRLLYSPHAPNLKQHAFLLLDDLAVQEAMYGGAAGGGKSDALLMSALRYVDVPGYAALLLRRTYADLALPGALMDRANTWLAGTDATWNGGLFRWTFPSSATLTFGYLQTSRDKYRYASAEFQYIGFDELTQFPEDDYRFLFTRLRRPELNDDTSEEERQRIGLLGQVPLRVRGASNPGGLGHDWVKGRFILREPSESDPEDTPERARARIFIPASLDDNQHVDRESYRKSLAQADPVTRARLERGDWDVEEGDRVYSSGQLGAARHLGDMLDRLLATGGMPPPAGGLLAIGLDWGEHSHAVIGWPLAGGGLYVVAEAVGDGAEPVAFSNLVITTLASVVKLGRKPRPAGWRPPLDDVTLGRRPTHEPPALPARGRPLALVSDHRYDAAGIQSMRSYMAQVRRVTPNARSTKVPFGAPSPRSGTSGGGRSYKAETIYHLRRLLLNSGYGITVVGSKLFDPLNLPPLPPSPNEDWTGALAIGRRAPVLRKQLPKLEWLDREAGTIRKGDDHGPDSLIALDAPLAILTRR